MSPTALNAVIGALCLLADPVAGRAQTPDCDVAQIGGKPKQGAELLLLEVSINGAHIDGQFIVARDGEALLIRPEDFDRWRMRRPALSPTLVDGEPFFPLSALPGVAAQMDMTHQRLNLSVPTGLFEVQRVSAATAQARPTPGASAAFLNYDFTVAYDEKVTGAAFLEVGASGDWGLVASTLTVGQSAGGHGVTRFDSYWLRDNPEGLTRLVVGDTVTAANEWSRQIRFGGIRLGTEFGLQPDLITFPLPDFAGAAAVPSNVELFVNDALRFQAKVNRGAFSISQVPLVTGAGEVTLVVRDALGAERRVRSNNYYVSSRLLRRGLSAWSLEGGAERQDYGIKSFSYGAPFVAGSFRHGATDWLTLDTRVELGDDVQMAGAGANLVWPEIGEFGVAGAVSRGDDGKGVLWRVFYSRIAPDWSFAVSYQHASSDFDQLGIDRDEDRITSQLQVSGGVSLGRWGNIALAYTDLDYADRNRTRLASANYSVGIARKAYLSLFALKSRIEDSEGETTLGAALTLSFRPRSSAYVQADGNSVLTEFRQTPPHEGGWGYRLAASAGETDHQQAELRWRGDIGEASLEAARFEGDASLRLRVNGGLLTGGGRGYMTRRVQDGLGLVEVPGQANVRIYQENRLVARTDARGRAIIPDLRPYEENRISLAPSDLPIDASMPRDTMIVVPRFRGAANARFAVERDNPATILVRLPDGNAIEAGSKVRTDKGDMLFAGYGGEVFVERLRSGMILEIDTSAGPCRVTVEKLPSATVLPRIGPLTCSLSGNTL